jgi:hypothetical protein
MSDNYFNFVFRFDPPASGAAPANDNADWHSNLWLMARTYLAWYRRYRVIDPQSLPLMGRYYRAVILHETLTMVKACWQELSG